MVFLFPPATWWLTSIYLSHFSHHCQDTGNHNDHVDMFINILFTGSDSDITHIAATNGDDSYDQYVLPNSRISPSTTCVSGLALSQDAFQMYKNGEQVNTKDISEALPEFLQWLCKFSNPVLVAHGAKFDARILCTTILSQGCNSENPISGFVDTLSLLRKKLPGRISYKQVDLAKDLITVHYSAHDASADAQVLQKLVHAVGIPDAEFLDSSFSFQSFVQKLKFSIMKDKNSISLQHLVSAECISKITLGKISSSGLGYEHLKLAHQQSLCYRRSFMESHD